MSATVSQFSDKYSAVGSTTYSGKYRWQNHQNPIWWWHYVSNGNVFRVTGPLWGESTGSPHKGQWRGSWTNVWAINSDGLDLRRHCPHYDVIVMYGTFCKEHLLITSGFPLQRANNAQSTSMLWRHCNCNVHSLRLKVVRPPLVVFYATPIREWGRLCYRKWPAGHLRKTRAYVIHEFKFYQIYNAQNM